MQWVGEDWAVSHESIWGGGTLINNQTPRQSYNISCILSLFIQTLKSAILHSPHHHHPPPHHHHLSIWKKMNMKLPWTGAAAARLATVNDWPDIVRKHSVQHLGQLPANIHIKVVTSSMLLGADVLGCDSTTFNLESHLPPLLSTLLSLHRPHYSIAFLLQGIPTKG